MYNVIYVSDTNTGWTDKFNYRHIGFIPGYMRGFNVEFQYPDGRIDYGSMITTWADSLEDSVEIDDYLRFVNDIHPELVPTGNLVFRGYYDEYYDPYEREEFVELIKEIPNMNRVM